MSFDTIDNSFKGWKNYKTFLLNYMYIVHDINYIYIHLDNLTNYTARTINPVYFKREDWCFWLSALVSSVIWILQEKPFGFIPFFILARLLYLTWIGFSCHITIPLIRLDLKIFPCNLHSGTCSFHLSMIYFFLCAF